MPIDPLTLTSGGASITTPPKPGADGGGFQSTLSRMIDGIEQTSADANTKLTGMMEKTVDVHDAMIALQREELTLHLSMAIRNKFVNAYQEIMRMPI